MSGERESESRTSESMKELFNSAKLPVIKMKGLLKSKILLDNWLCLIYL